MNNQRFARAAMVLGGLCFAAAGCILGDDPNKNSQLFGPQAGATGNRGLGGAGGGAGSGAGLPDPPAGGLLATFDTTTESFAFSTFSEASNLATSSPTPPTLDFDAADGSPASTGGSLKVFAPYSGANQYVDVQARPFATTMLQNWAGGKLHVRVKVDTGSTFMGQIEPYADTTVNFTFVGSSFNVTMTAGWHEYTVPLDTAMTRNGGYDLKQVITYGVHIGSGTAGAGQGPVTFHIDTFWLEGVTLPTVDAGAGTGGSSGGSDAASGVDDASGN
jgi:hypothetical protein